MEMYEEVRKQFENCGYDIKHFNICDFEQSMQYNPFEYIEREHDVIDLVNIILNCTYTGVDEEKNIDDAEKFLLNAIMLYLHRYRPKTEHDFEHVMQLIVAADVPDNQENPQSELDKFFEQIEIVDPHGLALKMYKSFKSTSGDSLKSVLASVATKLTVFNYSQIEKLTCADTISLEELNDKKCALIVVKPPVDNGFLFLVEMMICQVNALYYGNILNMDMQEEYGKQSVSNWIKNEDDKTSRQLIDSWMRRDFERKVSDKEDEFFF